MLAIAVRIGQALCLHMRNPPFYVDTLEQELRRRTWQAIGVLDLATSLDRASEPMMQSEWLKSHPPANTNDEDIWLGMTGPFKGLPKGTFTEMSHSLIIAEGQLVARSILFTDFIEKTEKSPEAQQQMIDHFKKVATFFLGDLGPDQQPFQLYTSRVASIVYGYLQLGILRPLSRSRISRPPSAPREFILGLAARNLMKAQELHNDPSMAPWAWYGNLWVPWHALAVTLAELCICNEPAIFSNCWSIVVETYNRCRFLVADSYRGMLWKPLRKLMDQAKAHRGELLNGYSNSGETHQRPLNIAPSNQFSFDLPVVEETISLGPFSSMWEISDFHDMQKEPVDNTAWADFDEVISDLYTSMGSLNAISG